MSLPLFRVVCLAGALDGAPDGWASQMLGDGDVAVLPDASGLDGIDRLARALGSEATLVVRRESSVDRQDATVMAHAGTLPLVWLAGSFSDTVRTWARRRAPMTLLVEVHGDLSDDERGRIERFIALLGRQSE